MDGLLYPLSGGYRVGQRSADHAVLCACNKNVSASDSQRKVRTVDLLCSRFPFIGEPDEDTCFSHARSHASNSAKTSVGGETVRVRVTETEHI